MSAEHNPIMSRYLNRAADVAQRMSVYNEPFKRSVNHALKIVRHALTLRQRLYIAGNGGSAAIAMHVAAELTGYFDNHSQLALPAHALTADGPLLSALANDVGQAYIFVRQLHAYGRRDDVFLALTTSGKSENILRALATAKEQGMRRIALVGQERCQIDDEELAEVVIHVPATETPHIQELHLVLLHGFCACLADLR